MRKPSPTRRGIKYWPNGLGADVRGVEVMLQLVNGGRLAASIDERAAVVSYPLIHADRVWGIPDAVLIDAAALCRKAVSHA